MYTLDLSEKQRNYIYYLLDLALRTNGIKELEGVVDLRNALSAAMLKKDEVA